MLSTLKKRADFLRVRGGGRWATAAFVLEAKPRAHVEKATLLEQAVQKQGRAGTAGDLRGAPQSGARFGFTVTKKIGNAVKRNRIRRRLKAVVEQLAPDLAREDCDYVLIARRPALERPFADLRADAEQAFLRVHRALNKKRPGVEG